MKTGDQASMAGAENAQNRRRALPGGAALFHTAVFLISLLILYSRSPDSLVNAQFYAEDGARWYRDAYQAGWHSLLIPETGYLQTVSRLVALLALLVPISIAPLVMNLCAMTIQILPVNWLLSRPFECVPLAARLLGCLLYLGMPNSIEVHANTTNIQWHLGLLCILALLGGQPDSQRWRVIDVIALVLLSLDSPLGFLLLPIVALLWRKERTAFAMVRAVALIPGTIIQGAVFVFSQAHGRVVATLGPSLVRLTGIVGGQIFLSAVVGVRTIMSVFLFGDKHSLFLLQMAAMVLGIAVTLMALREGPSRARLFILFATEVLVLALSRPIAGPDANFPQWEYLQIPGRSSRYYFFPILAFYVALFCCSFGKRKGLARLAQHVAVAILALVPIGVYRDWRYPHYPDLHFAAYAREFERAQPGTVIRIPILPAGWEMELVKHE